jgi:hypothetical protein
MNECVTAFRRGVALRLLMLVIAPLLGSCSTSAGVPAVHVVPPRPVVPPAITLTTANYRDSGVVVSGGSPAPYNYAPSVMQDGGGYRVWWCSQVPGVGPGDDILYASASAVDGPFTADGGAPAVPVFTGQPGAFDAIHTCDPSVIKVGSTYYLYYTGAEDDHTRGNAVGVASSTNGLAWRRENGGRPIVTASGAVHRDNSYGAGQPSAIYLDGWFYLMFTDTTATRAGWNGAGQFVLRARNPEFSEQVQSLTDAGFVPVGMGVPRSVVDAFSADWMWVDALGAFAIAHQTADGTTITFWDADFRRQPAPPVVIPGPWQEGPGLLRRPDGHARVSTSDPCGTVAVDVFRATALRPAPTDIRHFGEDLTGLDACAQPRSARAVLDGFGVPSPVRTIDIVHGGARVRVDRRSVAQLLVPKILDNWVQGLEGLPLLGTIHAGAPALRAPSGEVALQDDKGRLWPVAPGAVAANGSTLIDVTPQQWDAYPHGDLSTMGTQVPNG